MKKAMETSLMNKNNLLNFEFISLCMITFMTLCNVAVFYNFHHYLVKLGLSVKEAGFIVGIYSLTAMVLYLSASRYISLDNAFKFMLIGIPMVAGCGIAYLFADSFPALVIVRIINGAAIFLIMASCTVVLIAIIPPAKTGAAFSLYSVAMLSPYSLMPALSEIVLPFTDSPTEIYMATSCLLLTAVIFIRVMKNRFKNQVQHSDIKNETTFYKGDEIKNIFQKPVIAILILNAFYFIIFSGLFFLFEGFAVQRGISSPGYFFTVQMGVMVAIRLLGGQIFDRFSKVGLVAIALLLTGTGFWLLRIMADTAWIFPIAVVFGLGMGLCVPPLNSLMYLVSSPRYRGYNANMMMLTLHFGTFTGPFVGSWIIDAGGYDLFLLIAALATLVCAGFFLIANPAGNIRPMPTIFQKNS